MESEQLQETAAPKVSLDSDAFAKALAKAFAESQGPRKVTIGEYQRRHARKVKLSREYTQNGHSIALSQVSDEQVKLLNRITRSGRYIKNKVNVIVQNEAQPTESQVVHILYSDATPDQRSENAKLFRDFTDLVKQIVDEQDVIEENANLDKQWLAERRAQNKASK